MPPPSLLVGARPLRIVNADILTVRFVAMLNTRLAKLPSTVTLEPTMLTLFVTSSSPVASNTVPVTVKLIVSPADALASAARSEPAPLSAVLETVRVAAPAVCTASRAMRRLTGFMLLHLDCSNVCAVAASRIRNSGVIHRACETALVGRRAAEVLAGINGETGRRRRVRERRAAVVLQRAE